MTAAVKSHENHDPTFQPKITRKHRAIFILDPIDASLLQTENIWESKKLDSESSEIFKHGISVHGTFGSPQEIFRNPQPQRPTAHPSKQLHVVGDFKGALHFALHHAFKKVPGRGTGQMGQEWSRGHLRSDTFLQFVVKLPAVMARNTS